MGMKTAKDYLNECIQVQEQRGQEYDKEGNGERSFAAAAKAFNALTGKDLKGSDVCLILEMIKKVRQYSNPSRIHEDSLLDSVSYGSLWAEELNRELFDVASSSKESNNLSDQEKIAIIMKDANWGALDYSNEYHHSLATDGWFDVWSGNFQSKKVRVAKANDAHWMVVTNRDTSIGSESDLSKETVALLESLDKTNE